MSGKFYVFVLGSALAAGVTLAPVQAANAGDVESGRKAFETCLGCHGVSGYNNTYPTYNVPKLGGQNAAYIVSALNAYRSGERVHPTMKANAWALTDENMADIAAYLESKAN